MGFYELKDLNIPTVPWRKFSKDIILDNNILWTLRVALNKSMDLSLPRAVGVDAIEAREKGALLLDKYDDIGMVIYYPYFIAEKSGVVEVNKDYIILEAVDKDLWNLVTYGHNDVTIKLTGEYAEYNGNKDFLSENEINDIIKNTCTIKSKYRDILSEGKSLFLEWSYAYNTDINKNPIGEKYLVFYEMRAVR
jgi:hypothetical protein